MKKPAFYPAFYIVPLILLTFVLTATVSAQTKHRKTVRKAAQANSQANKKVMYYLAVGRSGAGQYTKRQWQRVAGNLKRHRLPLFFAEYVSLPASEQVPKEWVFIRFTKRLSSAEPDALFVGPFNSQAAVTAAAEKFPELFPDEGASLRQLYSGDWTMGNYQLLGVRVK